MVVDDVLSDANESEEILQTDIDDIHPEGEEEELEADDVDTDYDYEDEDDEEDSEGNF